MPKRLQGRRTPGSAMPRGAIDVGPHSPWRNPFQASIYLEPRSDGTRLATNLEDARRLARDDFRTFLNLGALNFSTVDVRAELRGHSLVCTCPLPERGKPDLCHAAVLLEIANG